MPLRETAKTVPKGKTGYECGVTVLLRKLDTEDAEWLTEQLDNYAQLSWISTILKDEGHDVTAGILGRHRGGKCRCES